MCFFKLTNNLFIVTTFLNILFKDNIYTKDLINKHTHYCLF